MWNDTKCIYNLRLMRSEALILPEVDLRFSLPLHSLKQNTKSLKTKKLKMALHVFFFF